MSAVTSSTSSSREFVEEHLIQPTFITDHPIEISPLTKKKLGHPERVERFELYIYARGMCSAYPS